MPKRRRKKKHIERKMHKKFVKKIQKKKSSQNQNFQNRSKSEVRERITFETTLKRIEFI